MEDIRTVHFATKDPIHNLKLKVTLTRISVQRNASRLAAQAQVGGSWRGSRALTGFSEVQSPCRPAAPDSLPFCSCAALRCAGPAASRAPWHGAAAVEPTGHTRHGAAAGNAPHAAAANGHGWRPTCWTGAASATCSCRCCRARGCAPAVSSARHDCGAACAKRWAAASGHSHSSSTAHAQGPASCRHSSS